MFQLKPIMRCLVAAIAALLTSCLDCREEYWLQADGSGRLELTYRLPVMVAAAHGGESGIRETITGFLKATPEINRSNCEVVTEDGRIRVNISATFESAEDLKKVVSDESMEHLPTAATYLAGEVTTDVDGRTLDFRRRITPAEALPGSAFLPDSQLSGHHLTYIMHLPAVPEKSNATRTEDGGKTLVWDVPLARALKKPIVTSFTMRIPIPWRLVSALTVPISLFSAGWILRRRQKSRSRFPLGNPVKSVL